VLVRYEAMGSAIWRTDRDGAVSIRMGEGNIALSGWLGEHRRYWHGR
jgi:competence protein ComEC